MTEKLRANMLLDVLTNAIGEGQSSTETRIKVGGYPVVAVINPNEGPDEQLMEVTDMSWDHALGVLRLEISN